MFLCNNFLKKSTAIFLSATLLMGSFSAFSVGAAESDSNSKLGKIVYDEEFYQNNKELCQTVEQGLRDHTARIDISKFKLTISDAEKMFYSVFWRNPALFYVDSGYSYSYSNGYMYTINPVYLYSKEEAEELQPEVDKKVKEALACVNDSMTDFEKALALHDYIVLNCEYDTNKLYIGSTIYDCLVDKTSTCMGYSSTYAYLLSLVGIDSEFVESLSMNHAWNKVKIDGEYYNVDCTWDDPIQDKFGHISHQFFMWSDDQFQSNSSMRTHYDYTLTYPATSTKYDDMYIKSISNKMCFVNNSCYTIDSLRGNKYYNSLVEIDTTNGSVKNSLLSFNIYWPVLEKPNYYWNNGYYSIDDFDGKLYYSTDKDVFEYSFESGKGTKIAENVSTVADNYIYGMRINSDGEVVAALNDNPNNNTNRTFTTVAKLEKTPEPEILLGDVDGDEVLTVDDVTFIQMYAAHILDFTDDQVTKADFNKDGIINIVDATEIQLAISK